MIDVLLTLFVLAFGIWAVRGLFSARMDARDIDLQNHYDQVGDGENRSGAGETDQTKSERERQK